MSEKKNVIWRKKECESCSKKRVLARNIRMKS